MDFFPALLWLNDKLFGIEWHFWKGIGWIGNLIFFSRFFVQWLATERSKRVVVPPIFWWLSLIGSLCLLAYGIYRRDSVFIFAYLFTWIPYIRNLMIGHRTAEIACPSCGGSVPSPARFCCSCGINLQGPPVAVDRPAPIGG